MCASAILISIVLAATASATPLGTVQRDSVNADSVADAISLQRRTTFTATRASYGFGNSSGRTGSLLSGLLMGSYQYGNSEYFVRYISSEAQQGYYVGPYFDEWSNNVSILYGVSTTSQSLQFSIAAGVGYILHQGKGAFISEDSLGISHYQEIRKGELCIPVQAQMIFAFPTFFGFGITVFANLARDFTNYGFLGTFQFGDWSSPDPAPENAMSEKERRADSIRISGPRQSRSAVYLELLGSTGLYVFHYEHLLGEHVSLSVGGSYLPGTLSVPLIAHVFWMARNSGFELAAGVVPNIGIRYKGITSSTTLSETFFAGYRYQPFDGGEFVRFGWTPTIVGKDFIDFGIGISGGYCF